MAAIMIGLQNAMMMMMAGSPLYERLAYAVKMGGTIFFFSCFIIVLIYVFWPKNKAKFDRAAHQVLGDETLDQEET